MNLELMLLQGHPSLGDGKLLEVFNPTGTQFEVAPV